MKEPRRGHARRCHNVECPSEHGNDEHAFKNPLSKWCRRKRHKDDEAQLLDPDYEGGNENSQGLRSRKSDTSTATEPSMPQQKQHKPRTVLEQQLPPTALVEDLSTRTKIQPAPDKQKMVSTVSTKPSTHTSCQPLRASEKTRPLCPAERARQAFPGCRDKSPGPSDVACEPQRPIAVQSLDSLLAQLCPGGKHCLSMKIKDQQDSVPVRPAVDDKSLHTAEDVTQRHCNMSNFPSSFPASIEVLMTVNHSCGMHKTLSERRLHHDSSALSVVHTKPGHQQEIISIPKSRFIMVSALLAFVILACFSVTIYSFSMPPDYAMHSGNHSSLASKSVTPPATSATRLTSIKETDRSTSASTGPTQELHVAELIVQRLGGRRPTSLYLGHRRRIVML
ncbi:unnamed protein product [Ixodes pacificus]